MPGGVVIDKNHLRACSDALAQALSQNPVRFNVTLTDLVTMQDGRFNSYNPSFRQYFDGEARVIIDPGLTATRARAMEDEYTTVLHDFKRAVYQIPWLYFQKTK